MLGKIQNGTKFYIWKFLEGLKFIYAINIIYLLDKGVTTQELALSASIIAISSILFEIPTGYIADKFSRKLSISLGFLSQGISFLLFIFVNSFAPLAIASIFRGLGNAFVSGSAESFLFDDLNANKQRGSFLKTSSHGTSIKTAAGALATFLGPLMYIVNKESPFVLTALFYAVLAVFVLTLDEKPGSHEVKRVLKIFDGIKNVFKVRPLVVIMLVDILLLVFVDIFYKISFFPKINMLGLPIKYLGIMDGFNLLLMTLLLLVLPKFKIKNDRWAVGFYTLIAAVAFVSFSLSQSLALAILFGISFDLIYAARKQVVPSVINPHLASENRALSISSMSFVSSLGSAILLPIATYFFGISYWYSLIPLATMIILLFYYPQADQ